MNQIILRQLLLGLAGLASTAARADQFNVDEMPIGAEVTLPQTATTLVPFATAVSIASTDSPQTISIVAVGQGAVKATPVMLSIYDVRKNIRIKHVQIAPGTPFLYSFKGLSEVRLNSSQSEGNRGMETAAMKLKIESDKPITVSR